MAVNFDSGDNTRKNEQKELNVKQRVCEWLRGIAGGVTTYNCLQLVLFMFWCLLWSTYANGMLFLVVFGQYLSAAIKLWYAKRDGIGEQMRWEDVAIQQRGHSILCDSIAKVRLGCSNL